MTTATLRASTTRDAIRPTPSLPLRIVSFVGLLREVLVEAQEMRREAERRYPRLRL